MILSSGAEDKYAKLDRHFSEVLSWKKAVAPDKIFLICNKIIDIDIYGCTQPMQYLFRFLYKVCI